VSLILGHGVISRQKVPFPIRYSERSGFESEIGGSGGNGQSPGGTRGKLVGVDASDGPAVANQLFLGSHVVSTVLCGGTGGHRPGALPLPSQVVVWRAAAAAAAAEATTGGDE